MTPPDSPTHPTADWWRSRWSVPAVTAGLGATYAIALLVLRRRS